MKTATCCAVALTQVSIDSYFSFCRFLNESYKRAMVILRAHRTELDLLADALLNYETLDADDIRAIIEGKHQNVMKKLQQQQLAKNGSNGDRASDDGLNKPQSPVSPGGIKKTGQEVLAH